MNKKLIINADDFGLDKNVTDAIVALAQIGAISSTTVMSNFVQHSDLIQLKGTNVSIGLHLNLIEGFPVSNVKDIPTLVDDKGEFFTWKTLLMKFISGTIKPSDIETEIANQFEVLKTAGVEISHADSHKHIHQYPVLGPFILNTLKRLDVKRVRNCNPVNWNSKRMLIIKTFNALTKAELSPFFTTDGIITYFSTHPEGNFTQFVQSLQKAFDHYDCLEVMTHPAIQTPKGSPLNQKAEFDYLRNDFINHFQPLQGIKLISYAELNS